MFFGLQLSGRYSDNSGTVCIYVERVLGKYAHDPRYLVLDGVREVVMMLRHSLVLPLSFVLLCLIPISLLHGGIIYWIFMSLSDTIATLEAKQQSEKLELFVRLWKVA